MKIYLIYDNSDLFAQIETELEIAFAAEQPKILLASNEQAAKTALPDGDFDLVITPLHIRQTSSAPLSQEERGLSLVRWMNSNRIKIPSILIVPTYTDSQCNCPPPLESSYTILSSSNLIQDVTKLAKQILRNRRARLLDVEINLAERTRWRYKLLGIGFPYEADGDLELDRMTVENLLVLSRTLDWAPKWLEVLQNIGSQLVMHLFDKNGKFAMDVGIGIAFAGGDKNARVRFVVERDMHDIALEAIFCPRSKDRYWMLEAPVYRRLAPLGVGNYLFDGGKRINSLFIDGSVSGYDTDLNLLLPSLTSPPDECSTIKNLLSKSQAEFNVGETKLLGPDGKNDGFSNAESVEDCLEQGEWDLVHFAGHSYYDPSQKRGYVFLPGRDARSFEKVELERLSDWLRKTSFVYFSSCDSGAAAFVFALAERRIPNIVGFRSSIEDPFACEYAERFYRSLFERRSIERAFLEARRSIHGKHPDSRIWAAALLIEQVREN
jgi:hypothetical protein